MKPAVVLAAAALGIALAASSSQASTPLRIVFAADRAPTVAGEIYRLDPNGHRVNLSKSPYQDTNPAVSWDGRRVAFVSNRGGKTALYEVGIDGRGLHRMAPSIQNGTLFWQPHGGALAVSETGSSSPNGHEWIVPPNGKPFLVSHYDLGALQQPWSPDGRVLLTWAGAAGFQAVSPEGTALWTADAIQSQGAWSSQGLLAAATRRGVAVYDETGRDRFNVPLGRPWPNPGRAAWSADGTRLAVVGGSKLEVLTSAGMRLLERRDPPGGDMVWAGDSEVVFGYAGCATCKAVAVDVRTGKTSSASRRWLGPRSRDGKLAIATPARGQAFSLGAALLGSGRMTTYAPISGCYSDASWTPAASSLQFAGSSRSIVYGSWGYCDEPFANLYALGTSIHRLTNAQAQETQPAVSPDGTQIAYVWANANGLSCKGCSDGIRVANASGKPLRTLTNPENCTFDDSPSWSPDGSTIVYSESTCDSPGELFTIPATGGTPHDLGIKGQDPAWGPSKIAFAASDVSSPCGGLCTMNSDGSDIQLVATRGEMPAWSRDGRLAYLRGDLYHRSVVVGTAAPVKLQFARVTWLGWTPDGVRLVVVASKTKLGPSDLWTLRTDGTHPVQLTKDFGVWSRYFGPGG